MKNTTKLNGGLLGGAYEKVRKNYYERIRAAVHAGVYSIVGDDWNAEPEFAGKYLDLCARRYAVDHDERAYQNGLTVIEGIEKGIRPDGWLGCLKEESKLVNFSIWNHSFTLYGLCRFYEETGEERALPLIRRAADFLCDLFLKDNPPDILDAINDGTEHVASLYSMTIAYRVTKDARYAEYCKYVIDTCEASDLNILSFDSIMNLRSRKGIEMIVIYLGVLEYGRLFGDARCFEAAARYWKEVNSTQIRNTGNTTVKELWTEGGNLPRLMATEEKPNETCVAVGWIELSLALFFRDPKACYLDAIEKTLFNHMAGSLEKSGADLAYYQGNFGHKIFRKEEGLYQCCRYRGFTLFTYLTSFLWYETEDTVIPMVYAPTTFSSSGIEITEETDFPVRGDVAFRVKSEKAVSLLLRVPVWCKEYSVSVGGKALNLAPVEGYLKVALPAGEADVLLSLVLPLESKPCEIDGKPYISYEYGALLLAHDTRFGDPLWTEVEKTATPEKAEDTEDALVHFRAGTLDLVDFASAGSRNPGEDEYTVFIPTKE